MKLKEAKTIMSYIMEWQFVLMGVKERSFIKEKIDLTNYSLQDLIDANKIIASNNRRKMSLQKYNREKGNKVKGFSQSMLLADRAIAAVYTAIHFSPNGEMIALINDIGVGCVTADYKK